MPYHRHFVPTLVAVTLAVGDAQPVRSQNQTAPGIFRDGSSHSFDVTATDTRILLGGSALALAAYTTENSRRAGEMVDRYFGGVVDVGDVYGSVWGAGTLTIGLGGVGLLARRPALTNAAVDLGKSLAVTAVVVAALKVSVDRTRPSGSGYSFPSGHTATAFTSSTVLDKHFGWKVGLAAYTAAALTGLARMEDHHHYLSDVIAGATIGLLVGRIVPSRYGDTRPYLGARRVGVSYHF